MILPTTYLNAYYAACAPQIGRSTIAAIVKVESGGDPWAINDNTTKHRFYARDYADAVRAASALIREGHSVDMGLAQVNSENLSHVRMNVAQVFAPCGNLVAAAEILEGCYAPAAMRFGAGQQALVHALSCYNTGSLYAGMGYVKRVLAAARAAPAVRRLASIDLGMPSPNATMRSFPVVRWGPIEKWNVF